MKLGTHLLFRLLVTVAAVISLFESFHLRVLRRPAEGVRVGTLFLAQLFERSTGRLPAALGAYTAGPRRPPRWREQPEYRDPDLFAERIPFAETRQYVKVVRPQARLWAVLYGGSALRIAGEE